MEYKNHKFLKMREGDNVQEFCTFLGTSRCEKDKIITLWLKENLFCIGCGRSAYLIVEGSFSSLYSVLIYKLPLCLGEGKKKRGGELL